MKSHTTFFKFFACIAFTLSLLQFTQAQRPGGKKGPSNSVKITGKIIDRESSAPLEFATISFYSKKDSTLVTGGISEEGGVFNIESHKTSIYGLAEYIAYNSEVIDPIDIPKGEKVVDLGVISLGKNAVALSTIEIRAEKSETQFALDKKVFNVGQDLANKGGSAEDILNNVPSVSVDLEGEVSLRGSSNVRILVNGKPSGLIGISGTNGLRSLSANMIDKIEVITNPSARYEAEGMSGIINIVLRKEQRGGFNGSFEASLGYPEEYGVGAVVNYRKDRLNFFINYNIRNRRSTGFSNSYREFYQGDTTLITITDGDRDRGGLSNTVLLGMDYALSDKQTLTGSFLYKVGNQDNINEIKYYDYTVLNARNVNHTISDGDVYSYRIDDEGEDEETLEYSLNYAGNFAKKGQKLTASISYESEVEDENSDFTERLFRGTTTIDDVVALQRSANTETQNQLRLKADYVHPFSDQSKFETGLLTSIRNIDNDYLVEENINDEWLPVLGLSNNFRYDEGVYATYAIYGDKVDRFSYQLGVRAEHSRVKTELIQTSEVNDRSYTDFFPSGHINYEFPNLNTVQLSYSKRLRRPRFWDLNPFFTFSDNRNLFTGNPDLEPEYTDSYELGYLKYWESGNIGGSIYYRHTTNNITRIKTIDSEGITTRRPENIGEVDNFGLEFLYNYSGVKWVRLDGSFNFFRSIVNGFAIDEDFDSDSYSYSARFNTRFSFWNNADLQLRVNHRGPRENPQGRYKASTTLDLGFSKDFYNNNMTFTLSSRDLFNTRKRSVEVIEEDFFETGEFQWRGRTITATLSYRLNVKKQRKRNQNRGGGGDFEGGEF